jgi:hypothetical protein
MWLSATGKSRPAGNFRAEVCYASASALVIVAFTVGLKPGILRDARHVVLVLPLIGPPASMNGSQ